MAEKDPIGTVQVALRIRPLIKSEIDQACGECIEVVPEQAQVVIKEFAFTYNFVFPQHITHQELYDTAVKGLIDKLFEGYNVTILAYGQTNSGKTYTMGTNYTGSDGDSTKSGVIPQAVADIFDHIEANEDKFIYEVSASFMELYQEQCYDLLSQKEREHSIIELREDNKGVILPGMTKLPVTSKNETMKILARGSLGRMTGSTAMNQASSRSHAIFTVIIFKKSRTDKNLATTSKFQLVDLAGSERLSKTKASRERLKEGVKINQGLLALGKVISALGDGTNRSFIPYRDSKLTRLLQDSLGGNSFTLMVACVSPADYNLDETLSTLRYADRALHIRNKPIINIDPQAAEIARLNKLVTDLRLQLQGQKPTTSEQNNAQLQDEPEQSAKCCEACEKRLQQLEDANKKLTEELRAVKDKTKKDNEIYVDTTEDEEDQDSDEVHKDPDWRATPLFKRLQEHRPQLSMGNIPETSRSTKPAAGQAVKYCACKGICATKMCGCRKGNKECGASCKCNQEFCKNRGHNKENQPPRAEGNRTFSYDENGLIYKKNKPDEDSKKTYFVDSSGVFPNSAARAGLPPYK